MEGGPQTLFSGKLKSPCKLILSGEHSVVYGKPALLMCLSKFITIGYQVTRTATEGRLVVLSIKNEGKVVLADFDLLAAHDEFELKELKVLVELFQGLSEDIAGSFLISLEITSDIPQGSGMGSSASYSCALSAAVLHARKVIKAGGEHQDLPSREEIGKAADSMENIFHTNPSGCDVQIVLQGGCLKFERDLEKGGIKLQRLSVDKEVKFLVVNTNKKREGRVMIEKVRAMKDSRPDDFESTVNAMGDVTEGIMEVLGLIGEQQMGPIDYFELVDLVNMNQQYLQELGVSSKTIDEVVELMMEHEIHGKLTGAGGEGGCLLGFFIPKEKQDNVEAFKEEVKARFKGAYDVYTSVTVCKEGLSFE